MSAFLSPPVLVAGIHAGPGQAAWTAVKLRACKKATLSRMPDNYKKKPSVCQGFFFILSAYHYVRYTTILKELRISYRFYAFYML